MQIKRSYATQVTLSNLSLHCEFAELEICALKMYDARIVELD